MTEAEGTKKTSPTGVPSSSLVSSIAAASPSVVQPWLDCLTGLTGLSGWLQMQTWAYSAWPARTSYRGYFEGTAQCLSIRGKLDDGRLHCIPSLGTRLFLLG